MCQVTHKSINYVFHSCIKFRIYYWSTYGSCSTQEQRERSPSGVAEGCLQCSVLAAGMLLTGLVMSIAHLQTHSYPDFECETFSQRIHVMVNSTTGQYQIWTPPQFTRVEHFRKESNTTVTMRKMNTISRISERQIMNASILLGQMKPLGFEL